MRRRDVGRRGDETGGRARASAAWQDHDGQFASLVSCFSLSLLILCVQGLLRTACAVAWRVEGQAPGTRWQSSLLVRVDLPLKPPFKLWNSAHSRSPASYSGRGVTHINYGHQSNDVDVVPLSAVNY